MRMRDATIYIASSITIALGTFIEESLSSIAIWLLVMFWVVIADLAAGCYKVMSLGTGLRISKGMRDTMGKLIVYFAFVVGAVFVGHASNIDKLSTWCCMAVICGEGLSIFSNLLKAHGYNLNVETVVKLLQKKLNVETETKLIEKDGNKTNE